ncbi:long-chain fatty acid--CoA ligase [Nocardia puris]|uniref:AMP-dependent synthetase/ligase n=1 Tax=Nocardia puris TaxID=208602 RepID=UPI001893FD55|nr:AMP-dependent synthetase/ligase [Nocardia puris]MBF6210542.1 long-chain fatty acid--CoA ligase [Nocardia puris]MBF6369267.1 long-chain fatty acid--CoA ligase [Nocardia puris]MBF6457802.1 long-chain fatty acid--CoA ligase [Nocardia puris]
MNHAGTGPAAVIEISEAANTVPKLVAHQVEKYGERTALRWRSEDLWCAWTWRDYADHASRLAAVLAARGIHRGDTVAMMMRNGAEFHAADLGVLLVGATPFSVYNTSSVEQIVYLLGHAGARIAIVANEFAERVRAARAALPALEEVLVVADEPHGVSGLHALTSAVEPVDFRHAAQTAEPGDLVTLVYTSGTTGPPKGVALTHGNVCWMVESLATVIGELPPGTRMVSYLPMAHMLERMLTHYLAARIGADVTCCPDAAAVAEYLPLVRPELFVAPPRVWEKLRSALLADAVAPGRAAATIGLDACRVGLVGSAPTPPGLIDFFRGIGVPLTEAYGMTETSGLLTAETARPRPGSVGRAAPGCEIKVLQDGEICCRGGNVFSGYLRDPERTAETFDSEGWLRTGDIGALDEDGYLWLLDRKKELIITASGKNISPANIEAALKEIPLVGQACVIGEGRPYLTALLVLDAPACRAWAEENDCAAMTADELAEYPAVRESVAAGLAEVNSRLSHPEQIRKFHLIGTEWLPDSECLTPKMSLKRRGVHQRYAGEIATLYGEPVGGSR